MEVIIFFASLYQAKEGLIFYVHFFFYRRAFYLRGAAEMVLPFFHMKKASAAKNLEVFADALKGHLAPLGRILRYRDCIQLTATSSGRFPHFFPITLIYTKGPFKDHKRSPSAG